MNSKTDSCRVLVAEALERLPDFRFRRMFGGIGLYSGGHFFGLIYRRRLYFRTGEDTRGAYTNAGMRYFQLNPGQSLKNYYEVPADIREDHDSLIRWAEAAIKHSTKT